eukprot:CAMPEP_0194356848 /NCGR_PEP_ID=MMETSP0174-20130528/4421_1 /TAXON_ID=216777 /ORGANISM="Proboscia alata, Strain PI-D3" /LENGTH=226 /DNA_ID=CAMNT_0039126619 /DNA_START=61 /DNA_END=741 /DNA_ORIENTATION=+
MTSNVVTPVPDDDLANLEEIEREMKNLGMMTSPSPPAFDEYPESPSDGMHRNTSTGSSASTGGGAVNRQYTPVTKDGNLNSRAGEFWFPESRNCSCCNGFKHGCGCRRPGVSSCLACGDPSAPGPGPASQPYRKGPTGGTAGPQGGGAPGAPPSAPQYCKFETSPGGCRFAASCRFLHRSPPPAACPPAAPYARNSYAGGHAGPKPCMYFARGNCQYGASCRFAHV